MRRRKQNGGALTELAMFLPFLFLLLFGMIELARIEFTYYTLHKMLYQVARYLGTQQAVNFCDEGDAMVTAAKNFVTTGSTDGSTDPYIANFTASQISVRIERIDPNTGEIGECSCDSTGCDAAQGGQAPDFLVVSIPGGYSIRPNLPFMSVEPIPLRPTVRLPYGGT
jgi:hypothetical protein